MGCIVMSQSKHKCPEWHVQRASGKCLENKLKIELHKFALSHYFPLGRIVLQITHLPKLTLALF